MCSSTALADSAGGYAALTLFAQGDDVLTTLTANHLSLPLLESNQTLADRTRFELSPEKWLEFQTALDQPVSAKPKLKKLLSEPGLLG